MVLKWSGAVIIVLSTTLLGFSLARRNYQRLRELRDLQTSFQMLSAEITYRASPVPQAFQEIATRVEEPVSSFFREAGEMLGERGEKGLKEVWGEGVAGVFPRTSLDARDRDLLISVGHFLGVADQEHQQKQLALFLHQLKESEREALRLLGKNEKMWKYLGILGGLMLVILLY